MAEGILVSIIVPVYNVLPYLREALDSVIGQTYRHLEIIIVDDGSTDGSGELCDAYTFDPRVKVIHQENRGLSGARNTGLDAAHGEYLAFLDPDDAFRPEMIERLLQAIVAHRADIVVCGYDTYKTEGRLGANNFKINNFSCTGLETILSGWQAMNAVLVAKLNISVWNKLYVKRLWDGIRFPEGHVYEDIRTTPCLLLRSESVELLPLVMMNYRKRNGSITQTYTVQNMRDQLDAYRFVLEFLAHYQPPFPEKSILCFLENATRSLIVRWAEMQEGHASQEDVELLRKEIRDFAKGIHFRELKTKAAWLLFQYWPGMIIPARKMFQWLKRIFRRRRTRKLDL